MDKPLAAMDRVRKCSLCEDEGPSFRGFTKNGTAFASHMFVEHPDRIERNNSWALKYGAILDADNLR